MKILITGGAGFIGYHLLKNLVDENNHVTVCDNLSRGKIDSELSSLIERENVHFVGMDLTVKKNLDIMEKDYDVVYHLAAINGTRHFYEMPYEVLRVNILSLINILEWLSKTDCKKIVWTSSSETYSATTRITDVPIPTPENVPLAIDDVSNSRFSYAGSKIVGELLFINYIKKYGFDGTIVRPHNIYGPRMGHEHVIPEFIERIMKKENPFKIFGTKHSRAFCYVEDFVECIKLVAGSHKTKGEIINVGDDREEITMINLAKKMLDLFNFHPEIKEFQAPNGSVERRCPDISKARKLVGYKPRINLENGLKKTYEWYSKGGMPNDM